MIGGVAKEMPVTLGDSIIGLFFLLVTVLAVKNLPGILEISLLQRLPLDAGARYAVTALSQYLITAFGVAIAFSSLGLEWSNIQWLVAALGVGLGFGLQEIVANFISGIILLFERPIRVGDVGNHRQHHWCGFPHPHPSDHHHQLRQTGIGGTEQRDLHLITEKPLEVHLQST